MVGGGFRLAELLLGWGEVVCTGVTWFIFGGLTLLERKLPLLVVVIVVGLLVGISLLY